MESRRRLEIGRDRLSNLPEPIIHHILSFMDMKLVIPTSMLSRRWRNLWYSLPTLSFNNYVFQDCLVPQNYRYRKFSNFVTMVLLIPVTSPIQSFNLIWFDNSSKMNRIDQWIRTAVLRNVKEINLQLESDFYLFEFPDCLFTSKTLTSLKLCLHDEAFEHTTQVKLVDKICLPSLKTLHLGSLNLSAYDNFFDILFVGCPALETLILMQCEFTGSKVLTISSLHLKHLHIDMRYYNELLGVFVIHASNLLDYTWRSVGWSTFYLESLSSLDSANINISPEYRDNGFSCKDRKDLEPRDAAVNNGILKCLKELYNVKHLTLSRYCLQLISEFSSELGKWPIVFCNLRYLKLQTRLTRSCFEVTMFLLKNSPNVETLVLHMDTIELQKTVEHEIESSFDLKLHHLKVVKFLGVSGCKNELHHMRILLGNAEALEKITIVKSRKRNYSNAWKIFTAKVLALPRASPDVIIIFQAA